MRPELGLKERRTQVEEHCPLARGVSLHGQDDVVEGDAPGCGVAPVQRDVELATVECTLQPLFGLAVDGTMLRRRDLERCLRLNFCYILDPHDIKDV